LSQKNFGKLTGSSSKFSLAKNKTSNKPLSSTYRKDSSSNILLEDNFIKNLLTKYLDGTDNIINEDLEPFNCFGGDEDYEHLSFFGENNNESNTIRESLKLNKKYQLSDDIKKENNLTINNQNINSSKIKKKVMNLKKKDNNQIKTNFYSSFMNSPNRMSEGRLSMRSQTRFTTLNKKITDNIPKKRNSLKNIKKIQKDGKIDDNKESKLKRKIIYSNKIISSLNRSKPISNKNSEINEQGKKVLIPTSSNNLNLDIIFENNKILKNDQISHHYLAQTVSAKNKIVQKKINSFEDSKNTLKSCNKISTICIDTDNNNNNNLFRKTIFRLNRTPKIRKDFKTKDRYSFNNSINNFSTRNNIRKYSFRLNREISSEFNISGMSTMINSKIFTGKIDDYLIAKELGKGSYAVVKLATHKLTKNKYAIKIYSKQSLIDPQKRNTVKNEVNILKQIDNENVMKLYDVIDTPSNLYLVLEYINGINLLEIIKNEKYHFLKEERAKKIFLQVVKGISYCHKKNIFHRDIKLENILVLKDDTIKIIDFGFGIKCNKDTYQKLFCGTPSYMPPEIVKKEKYIACYSDIWSLGVLFYAMLFGIFPFKGKDDDELFKKIIEAKLSFPEYNQIGDKTKELFNKIFVINPNRRISLDDMINILQE
jgi:tRNA A-37 threonylcarbamoyl transferase component Bud32